MTNFATIEDVETLFRPLKESEEEKAEKLLEIVSDLLRNEAKKVGKDLDKMIVDDSSYKNVVKSVTVDVVARVLMTSTDAEPMTQYAEAAGGYSVSGSFLNPGGGVFIKKTELSRLGFKRQRMGVVDLCP